MVSVDIITIGKLKEKFWREACGEYTKRLSAFCAVKIIEYPEGYLPGDPSQKAIEACLAEEGRKIMDALHPRARIYALCVEGRNLSSEAFAEDMNSAVLGGAGKLQFIVGSSHGLAEEVKARADIRLSFSRMTFPHQLMRVILCEQVYRSFTIINHHKYHK